MHTIKLKVEDSVYEHIMFLLNGLKSKGVVIETDEIKENDNNIIDFSKYKIDSLTKIQDPVKWQNDIRDEWDKNEELSFRYK